MFWETGYFNNTKLTHPIVSSLSRGAFVDQTDQSGLPGSCPHGQLLTFPTTLFYLSFFYMFLYFQFFLHLSVDAVKAGLFVIGQIDLF